MIIADLIVVVSLVGALLGLAKLSPEMVPAFVRGADADGFVYMGTPYDKPVWCRVRRASGVECVER